MASALLASSRNEPFWGEQKVYMRKNPNPNPRPVPDNPGKDRPRAAPTSTPFAGRIDHAAVADDPRPSAYTAGPAVSDDSSSFNHHKPSGLSRDQYYFHRPSRKESGLGGSFVSFNIAACSRRELQDLKRRLISELEQVRRLSSRIESGNLQIARSTGFSASSYGGGSGGGGREVTSAAAGRPPPLLLNESSLETAPIAGLDRRTPTGGDHYPVSVRDETRASLPPDDKPKKISKRTLPLTSPRELKRQATSAESEKAMAETMRKCSQILMKLMKHKHGWVFNAPVDAIAMGLHDYHQIIKHPMDLGSVKSQLEKNIYSSPTEFAADVRLTFNNALLYNPDGHEVHVMAERLLHLFEKLFAEAYKAYDKRKPPHSNGAGEEKKKKSSSRPQVPMLTAEGPPGRASPSPAILPAPAPAPAPTVPLLPAPAPVRSPSPVQQASPRQPPVPPPSKPLQQPLPVVARPATGKQPKPKAKDPHKREMSFEEKKKLSLGLQSLPQEKMTQVLQIVQRRNADPALQGDEIELDFEVLDTETLWELDRFVCNCKKMMSKMKRQEAMMAAAPHKAENAEKTESLPPAMEMMPEGAYEKKGKRGAEPGEEDVDIGEDMPSSHFPPVEIEKDAGCQSESSSSGSSSSDSSSSDDSDSRSSSDSDSDADDAQSPAAG